VINEPHANGQVVNRADVHMETAPFQDADPGQLHRCTDWEIWTNGLGERVWFAGCLDDTGRVHTHLGDGEFEGTLTGQTALVADTDYVLRVRHRDDSGDPATEWSSYATRTFHTEADQPPIPGAPTWCAFQPGYRIEEFASGFQLPVNIAFVPNATGSPTTPLFYVTELYGSIKVVLGDGSVQTYASGLLNFNPNGEFPGSGELGLTGIVVEPATGDVFASLVYETASGGDTVLYPKVIRLHSTNGGLSAASQSTVLDMVGDPQGPSHQVSNLTFGPDGKLYVHVGDGFIFQTAQNLDLFRGKILRVNLDGSPPSDNPFYDPSNGINARDYVFAYGFRNPFGGAWRASEGAHYSVENGPSVDRFARITRGTNYLWNDTDDSMRELALYNWDPAHAPVNVAFVEENNFHLSGFPEDKADHAYVSESGPTFASGPQPRGKRIVEFEIEPGGGLLAGPTTLVEYNGTGRSTVAALAAGPNGLYFSELYAENSPDPTTPEAKIYRVRFTGGDEPMCAPAPERPVPLTQLLKRNSPSLCIDVPGGSDALSLQLQTKTCNRAPEQTWEIGPKGNDEYEIRRAGTGLCVDIFNGDPFPGQIVTQYACNDTAAQRFNVEPLAGGGARVRNVHTDLCVSTVGSSNASLAKLELRPCNGSDAQAFLLDPPSAPPLHQLTKKESPNLCIDVPGGSFDVGTRLQIWECNVTNAQLWRLTNKAPGQFEMRRAGTNLCFDTPGAAFQGQSVTQATCNSSATQRFHAEPLPGGVQLRRVGTNLCVDVINNANEFATPLQLWECNGTAAQIFALDTPVTQLQKRGSNLCIDVPFGTDALSVQLQTKTCSRAPEQTWQIGEKGNGEYEIRRAGTGLCVDILNGQPFVGQLVTQYACNDTAAQRFNLEPTGGGAQIRNVNTNLCVNVAGTKLALGNCNGSDGQAFLMDSASVPQIHELMKKDSPDMCIDVPGGSFIPGTQLQLWECNRTSAQTWQLVPKTTAQVEVRRAGTNLCFGTPGGSAFEGQALTQATCNNSTSQRFHGEPMPGGVQLRRTGTNLCADVENGSNDFGAPLKLWTCNGTAAQIFAVQ
jgi:glucose/arabinose dehydrogenase